MLRKKLLIIFLILGSIILYIVSAPVIPIYYNLTLFKQRKYSPEIFPPATGCFNNCKGTTKQLFCNKESKFKIFGRECYYLCSGTFSNNCFWK